jgi:hypothetical protein
LRCTVELTDDLETVLRRTRCVGSTPFLYVAVLNEIAELPPIRMATDFRRYPLKADVASGRNSLGVNSKAAVAQTLKPTLASVKFRAAHN